MASVIQKEKCSAYHDVILAHAQRELGDTIEGVEH